MVLGRFLAVAMVAICCIAGAARNDLAVAAPPAATPAVPDYKLGSNDKVRVITFGEDALTGEFSVAASGKISFPLIGEIDAAGLTVVELQQKLAQTLRGGYLKDPRVSIEVLTYRPFYILGEVNKPGEYPFANGLTVMGAVATANGFTYRANKNRVFIKQLDGVAEQSYPLTSMTPVRPGDTIRIGERHF